MLFSLNLLGVFSISPSDPVFSPHFSFPFPSPVSQHTACLSLGEGSKYLGDEDSNGKKPLSPGLGAGDVKTLWRHCGSGEAEAGGWS